MPKWPRRRTTEEQSVFRLVSPLLRQQRARLAKLSAASVGSGLAEAAVLVLIARLAFALTKTSSSVTLNLGPLGSETVSVTELLVFGVALVVIRMGLQAISSVLATRATQSVVQREREQLIRAYLMTGWPIQAALKEGRLQQLLTTYVNSAALAVGGATQVAINAINLGALLVTALFVNWIASVGAAVVALVIGLTLRPLRAAVRRRARREAAANLDFATGLTELASTLQEVRIFGVRDSVEQRLDHLNRRQVRYALATNYAASSIGVLYTGFAMILIIGALGIAHAASVSNLTSLGAVVLILLRSLGYAQSLQLSIQGFYQTAPYIEALNEELREYQDAIPQSGSEHIASIDTIAFQHASFAYVPKQPVLHDISFEVPKGEIVGIIGPSGSGKSTLVQLLLRLRTPTTGSYLLNGRDIRDFDLEDWYHHVALVPQDAHLFEGSVADNIRFFREHVDESAIQRAAKLANLHDEIEAWPRGYDTPTGQRGSQISGGQRQRVCIARALIDDPDVIVLDEPTSALDVRSEALIRETMRDLAPDRTVFVIAHRMSTVAICDRIMVMMGGVLEGFDTPTNLERSNPFYREALKLSGMLQ